MRCTPFRPLLRAVAGLAALVSLALVAARPAAADPPSQIERWKGRYCTAIGCTGTAASPWGMAAGFGGAVLAAGWIRRRRSGISG